MPVLSNPKHERFAQELAKGKTSDEAYVLAGYKENRGNASTLKSNQNVLDRVQELLSRAAVRAEVTVASIIAELDEARELARTVHQPAAMTSASMGKAKVAGLLVERTELTGKDGGAIQTEEVNARELVASRIAGLAARKRSERDHTKLN